jgi:hypothetical protein
LYHAVFDLLILPTPVDKPIHILLFSLSTFRQLLINRDKRQVGFAFSPLPFAKAGIYSTSFHFSKAKKPIFPQENVFVNSLLWIYLSLRTLRFLAFFAIPLFRLCNARLAMEPQSSQGLHPKPLNLLAKTLFSTICSIALFPYFCVPPK